MNHNPSPGWFILCFGLIISALVMASLVTWVGPFARADLEAARDACEKSLPRDQHCVYQYVPEVKHD